RAGRRARSVGAGAAVEHVEAGDRRARAGREFARRGRTERAAGMTLAAEDARDRVGPYLVLRAIGAGGSARVDLARIDRAYNFQRHVVIKRPLEHLRANPQVAASLHREARI